MFSVYKASLKRLSIEGLDWYDAHLEALASVTATIARNLFRLCEWPGCHDFDSEEEEQEEEEFQLQAVLVISCALLVHHQLN
jgi:hypothetical protein